MKISDSCIVEQVRQGEAEAYSELVLRYKKPIYNLMFRFCYSTEEAAELTQDVFCNAFEKLSSFKTHRPFFPWLYTLAMNHGRDWKRQNYKKTEGLHNYSQILNNNIGPSEVDKLERKQEVDQVFLALSTLPDEKREMLLLKYKQDLTIRELGEIFGLSDSGVKMRIHRAIATLQDLLSSK
ncbi:MAG: RNA polymerase sigma-70 factor (ECF subfamily) [Desulforhopalus sp.]|jgi:RNA polymerase sigma-70 factor (ECF subfamily)